MFTIGTLPVGHEEAAALTDIPDADRLPPMRRWGLAEVRRIVLDRLGDFPARVYLIGSHARGTWHRYSDIDVAIDPARPMPPETYSDIVEALEESTVPYFVDVIDVGRFPDLAERARSEGVRECRTAGLLTDEQAAAALGVIDDRNLVAYTYKESVAVDLRQRLSNYADLLETWCSSLTATMEKSGDP